MSVWQQMASDAGFRGEEAEEVAAILEADEYRRWIERKDTPMGSFDEFLRPSGAIELRDGRVSVITTEGDGLVLEWRINDAWNVIVVYGADERPYVHVLNHKTREDWELDCTPRPRHTPEDISVLEPDEIFVFGSNTAGRHGAGAALLAREKFGAQYGVGEGPTGSCYALPTLNGDLSRRSIAELDDAFRRFADYAARRPELTFLLTRVGTGLAGYPEATIKSLVRAAQLPKNVVKPEGW
jgi:hypothetical protein